MGKVINPLGEMIASVDSVQKRRFGKKGDNLGESIKKEMGMKELKSPLK